MTLYGWGSAPLERCATRANGAGTECLGSHQCDAEDPSAAPQCAGDAPTPQQQRLPLCEQPSAVQLMDWDWSRVEKTLPLDFRAQTLQRFGCLACAEGRRLPTSPHCTGGALGWECTFFYLNLKSASCSN